MNWKNLRIASKIVLCYSIPLVLMIAIGAWTFRVSQNVFRHATQARDESVVFSGIAQDMSKEAIQIQQWLTDISATRGLDGLNDGFDEAESSYQSLLSDLSKFRNMYESENDSGGLQKVEDRKAHV